MTQDLSGTGAVDSPRARTPLVVEGLTVAFGRGRDAHVVVDDVSFRIDPGEVVALVGESGSGKSTIAKAILGTLPAAASVTGAIRVGDVDVLAASPAARRRLAGPVLAAIPQDPLGALDPLQRIGRQVGQVLRLHGDAADADARVSRALERAGLEPAARFVRRWPHELSGGQRQRALIAAALVAHPSIIVADEPTSALDVTVQRRVLDRLRDLVDADGASMLLVTHDLGVAADRAERILVLDGGRLVEHGPTRSVLAAPASSRARALVDALPRDDVPAADAGSDGEPMLVVDGVSKRFGGVHGTQALADVDLVVPEHGAVGVVGASGSGKSTLARIVLGLERADAGIVTLAGAQVVPLRGARDRRRRARDVQPVFQDPSASLDPRLAVGRSIAEPLGALGVGDRRARTRRVAELLDLVRLDAGVARRRPHELSGGQLQRVAIARALATTPRLLLCDEPVSALDASVQSAVLDVLADARRELGTAILLISHDLAVVRRLCADVVVLHEGRVVERGPTADVLTSPTSAVAQELVASVPGSAARSAPRDPIAR